MNSRIISFTFSLRQIFFFPYFMFFCSKHSLTPVVIALYLVYMATTVLNDLKSFIEVSVAHYVQGDGVTRCLWSLLIIRNELISNNCLGEITLVFGDTALLSFNLTYVYIYFFTMAVFK